MSMQYTIVEILEKKIGKHDFGCIYCIKNTKNGMCYIGQTYTFFLRSKAHVFRSKRVSGLLVDMEIGKDPESFVFIVLKEYEEMRVNFFNRKIRTIEEHKFIKELKSYHPHGYNQTYFESLSVE